MKVYLVENRGNAPGRIYAIFASEADAIAFMNAMDEGNNAEPMEIVERTLFYGQPPLWGYNE